MTNYNARRYCGCGQPVRKTGETKCHHCRRYTPTNIQLTIEFKPGFCIVCTIVRLSKADSGSVCMYCMEDAVKGVAV